MGKLILLLLLAAGITYFGFQHYVAVHHITSLDQLNYVAGRDNTGYWLWLAFLLELAPIPILLILWFFVAIYKAVVRVTVRTSKRAWYNE